MTSLILKSALNAKLKFIYGRKDSMKIKHCAYCEKEIDTVREGYVTCRDNFLQVKYFEDPDGRDNIFCSEECACESLMIERVYDN